ncbi:MAG: DUF4924 family protein [Lachnospiraceae bacterium]|nr:DUF4924 family protein [Prevotella sp.]MCM1074451.1 DUF4924 family protein [Ruminococcus sp.]MCM1225171.1 DUF4924 family protein [Lachnospiraceae bacterium]
MIDNPIKKNDNVAEYILYMWQIEDLIRANKLDMELIRKNIIDKYTNLTDEQRREPEEWYESLIDMMRREGIEKSGHLQMNKNLVGEMADLCRRLIKDPKYSAFANQYYATLPLIVELRAKSGAASPEEMPGEIEACLTALYGVLLLRLQSKEVSPQTMAAVSQISKFLGTLSAYYKKDYNDELDLA